MERLTQDGCLPMNVSYSSVRVLWMPEYALCATTLPVRVTLECAPRKVQVWLSVFGCSSFLIIGILSALLNTAWGLWGKHHVILESTIFSSIIITAVKAPWKHEKGCLIRAFIYASPHSFTRPPFRAIDYLCLIRLGELPHSGR